VWGTSAFCKAYRDLGVQFIVRYVYCKHFIKVPSSKIWFARELTLLDRD
jgi:hypothetical protein